MQEREGPRPRAWWGRLLRWASNNLRAQLRVGCEHAIRRPRFDTGKHHDRAAALFTGSIWILNMRFTIKQPLKYLYLEGLQMVDCVRS